MRKILLVLLTAIFLMACPTAKKAPEQNKQTVKIDKLIDKLESLKKEDWRIFCYTACLLVTERLDRTIYICKDGDLHAQNFVFPTTVGQKKRLKKMYDAYFNALIDKRIDSLLE